MARNIHEIVREHEIREAFVQGFVAARHPVDAPPAAVLASLGAAELAFDEWRARREVRG